MHQNVLSITRIHILRSYLNLVCAHKLEIDALVNVASEETFEGTREEKVYNGTMDH